MRHSRAFMKILPSIYCGSKEAMDVCGHRKPRYRNNEIWRPLAAEYSLCIRTQGKFLISSPNKQRVSWRGKSRSWGQSLPHLVEWKPCLTILHNIVRKTNDDKTEKKEDKAKENSPPGTWFIIIQSMQISIKGGDEQKGKAEREAWKKVRQMARIKDRYIKLDNAQINGTPSLLTQ